jgi:hypothetical protein
MRSIFSLGDIRTSAEIFRETFTRGAMEAFTVIPPAHTGDVTLVETHDRVEARVAELVGAMNVATAELVALIADVLENETWCTAGGIKSPEHWVTWQCGVSHAHAESLVKMARRRAELPKSFALFETGQITEDVMATVARRATPERDTEVAERLPHLLYSQVDRMLRTLPQFAPVTAPAEERPSTVEFGQRPDGRWVLHANLALDEGAVVEQALKVARSEVFFERHPDAENETRSGNVTWADGLVRAAELALRQSAVVNGRQHRPGDRFQVWVHMSIDELRAKLHLGEALPDWLRRFLACDADVRATIESNDILWEISRKFRTVDEKMRAFIEERDGGCVVPGCQQKRWLHIHHIVHWENGGPTTPSNLCALCPMHHRLHHQGLLEIRGSPGTANGLRFFTSTGREITAVPRSPITARTPAMTRYVHPPGERVDWFWMAWNTVDGAALN